MADPLAEALADPLAEAPRSVRVVTWNLWWRFGPWVERQHAIAATLEACRPDLVCLQEVWATDTVHQAAALADPLGLYWVAADNVSVDEVEFTNAILSRWPISASGQLRLPGVAGAESSRVALWACVDSPSRPTVVISTHLDWQFDLSAVRVEQARAIADLAATLRADAAALRSEASRLRSEAADAAPPGSPVVPSPVVLLCGDLNATADSEELRLLSGRRTPGAMVFSDVWEMAGDVGHGWTWCASNGYQRDSTWPNRRIDYVLVGWPRPKGIGVPVRTALVGVDPVDGVVASDHYGVLADLRW